MFLATGVCGCVKRNKKSGDGQMRTILDGERLWIEYGQAMRAILERVDRKANAQG